MCPKVDLAQILPPTYKKGPGRPKKLRRWESDEDPNPSKLKRTYTEPLNEDVANVVDGASNQANETPNAADNNGIASFNPPNEVVNVVANNGGASSNPPNKPLNVATAKGRDKVNDKGTKVPQGTQREEGILSLQQNHKGKMQWLVFLFPKFIKW
ncbi:hypothetical protein SESBI_42169 [Sesbania bispinosa]|nr:hypothetical protein SESBI_42169 [Sesbania bispinosa]